MDKYARLRARVIDHASCRPNVTRAGRRGMDRHRARPHPDYVAASATARLRAEQRRIGFPWSPADGRALAALGGSASTRLAPRCRTASSANLAGGTHHAFPDRGEGYCVFNDVAVAPSTHARDRCVRRVAVVDLDVHQGNGTAAIFEHDPRVFTCSLHGAANFPFRKERATSTCRCPTAPATTNTGAPGGGTRRRAGDGPGPGVLRGGRRPLRGDRLGRMRMTDAGLRQRDAIVFGRCQAERVPVAVRWPAGMHPTWMRLRASTPGPIAEAAQCARSGAGLLLAGPGLCPATLLRLGNPPTGIGTELALLARLGRGRRGRRRTRGGGRRRQ